MNVLRITRWCTLTALVALGTTIGLNQHISARTTARRPLVRTAWKCSRAGRCTKHLPKQSHSIRSRASWCRKRRRPPSKNCRRNKGPRGQTWLGFPAIGPGMTSATISCGSAASGAPCRQVANGCLGIGASPGKALNGRPDTGPMQRPARSTTCPSRRRRSRLVPTLPRLPRTIFGCQAVGFGSRTATHGALDTGRKGNQDWDWVPDHYVWTPSGYVFVDGYYDYSVPRRGVVFAPVYFDGGLRTQRGFSYSPSTVINPGVFVSHLFLRPGYGHYYFGDYYGSNYADAGFSPWFSYQSSRRGYDPIYANQRWQHRHDREWEHRAEADFRNFRDNENARPPRNWAAQRELAGRGDASNRRNIAVAAPLDELARKKDSQLRFQPVDQEERQQFGQRGQEYRKYLQQRQQLEANAARTPGVDPATAAGPARRKFSRSPFVATARRSAWQGIRAATATPSSQAGPSGSAPTQNAWRPTGNTSGL